MEVTSIYYNDNYNTFEDIYGITEYDISDIIPPDKIVHYKKVGGTYRAKIEGKLFDIEFPDQHLNRQLYYDIEANVMCDEDGFPIFNIFSIISANDLFMFKKNEKTVKVYGILGGLVELIWHEPIPF
jgi:hypothetical protein